MGTFPGISESDVAAQHAEFWDGVGMYEIVEHDPQRLDRWWSDLFK